MIRVPHTLDSLEAWGRVIPVSCLVRSLGKTGAMQRHRHEVVYTTMADGRPGLPYDPRPFPSGSWEITSAEDVEPGNLYLWPVILRTTAWQAVPIWEIVQEEVAFYAHETEELTNDWGYLIHYSTSPTTLGCLRVTIESDMKWLAGAVREELKTNRVPLIVEAS